MIAKTPEPPYFAVIFTSLRTDLEDGYDFKSQRMVELAKDQNGFIGIESAREDLGITVSYWKVLNSIRNWKENLEHKAAQNKGKSDWYEEYTVRITEVVREYSFKQLK